jgi:hypothetical protein
MEQIQFGGRRVAGFGGVGGFFSDVADTILDETGIVKKSTGSTPNPAYRQTAAITGQKVDPSAPADTLVDPAVIQANLQKKCAELPTWLQPAGGCSNVNTVLKPGESASTAPESALTIFGGGVDAFGRPNRGIQGAVEDALSGPLKTAAIVGAVVVGTVLVGGVLYAVLRR